VVKINSRVAQEITVCGHNGGNHNGTAINGLSRIFNCGCD
jgi:hypothetical protein